MRLVVQSSPPPLPSRGRRSARSWVLAAASCIGSRLGPPMPPHETLGSATAKAKRLIGGGGTHTHARVPPPPTTRDDRAFPEPWKKNIPLPDPASLTIRPILRPAGRRGFCHGRREPTFARFPRDATMTDRPPSGIFLSPSRELPKARQSDQQAGSVFLAWSARHRGLPLFVPESGKTKSNLVISVRPQHIIRGSVQL